MLSLMQAMILGLLQGVTELFPISSLGHTVLLPHVFGWQIDQHDPLFVSFIVATHLATALVLLAFFWEDWLRIITGVLRSLVTRRLRVSDTHAKLGWLLIVGTIPVGLLGLLFEKRLTDMFAAPHAVAFFLFCNGLLLLSAEMLVRRHKHTHHTASSATTHNDAHIARLSWRQAFTVGCLQCLALLPGFSRTGATLTGGLMEGLLHADAARFSFLLATPIIFAAAVLKLPHLVHVGAGNLFTILVGSLCSAVAAYISVRFLSRYFQTRTLTPFALYCLVVGALAFFFIS